MAGCKALTDDEINRVLNSFNGIFEHRNQALFSLGITTGFRISELLSITRGQLIRKNGEFSKTITVKAENMKGKLKSRTMELTPLAMKYLSYWLLQQQETYNLNQSNQYIFSKLNALGLQYEGAYKFIKNAYAIAGLPTENGYATHSMRKTFALKYRKFFKNNKEQFENNDEMKALQKGLGHRNINSTYCYIESLDTDVSKITQGVSKMFEEIID